MKSPNSRPVVTSLSDERKVEMVKYVLAEVKNANPITNRRAAVASKLLSSGHKSMLNFFVPEFHEESEPDNNDEQDGEDNSEASEESHAELASTVKIVVIDSEEIPLTIYDYPSDYLFEMESLLDYFMKSSDEVLPTATGYICTILESLFNEDATVVEAFKRLFCKDKYLERLFRHLDLTSVCNFLSRGLLCIKPSRDQDGNLSDQTIYYRAYLAYRLSQKLLESDDLDVVDNLTAVMKLLLNARQQILDSGFLIRVVILGSNFFGDLVKKACKSVV